MSRFVRSIGHSTHALEHFLDLLRKHEIEVLADVRSVPHSKWTPDFNRPVLEAVLKRNGFQYVFLGDQLGGIPHESEFYDASGHVLYYRLAQSPRFQEGIARLEKGVERYCVAMMCAEENPQHCHRHRFITRVLNHRGIEVQHIRGDGRLEIVPADPDAPPPGTIRTLFGEEEDREWISG